MILFPPSLLAVLWCYAGSSQSAPIQANEANGTAESLQLERTARKIDSLAVGNRVQRKSHKPHVEGPDHQYDIWPAQNNEIASLLSSSSSSSSSSSNSETTSSDESSSESCEFDDDNPDDPCGKHRKNEEDQMDASKFLLFDASKLFPNGLLHVERSVVKRAPEDPKSSAASGSAEESGRFGAGSKRKYSGGSVPIKNKQYRGIGQKMDDPGRKIEQ